MADREARVLGAGNTIKVGDKEYKLYPVVAKHLCDLERESLKYYKRQHLDTFSENMDLLPKDVGESVLLDEIRRLASWSLDDLPQRDAYDTSKIPVTDKLKDWIKDRFETVPEDDDGIRALIRVSLDQKALGVRDVRKLTGKAPFQGKVRYDQWWIMACTEGRISFIVSSLQLSDSSITRKDVEKWSFAKIIEAADKVANITSADMGNT